MFCPNCGSENHTAAKFCIKCGLGLKSSVGSNVQTSEKSGKSILHKQPAAPENNNQPKFGRKKKINSKIASAIGVMVFIVAFIAFRYLGEKGTSAVIGEPSKQELIQQAVQSAKSQTTFPQELDSITTFTDMIEQPGAIRYLYILHDADEAQLAALTNADLKDSIAPQVCSTPETRNNVLNKDINMEYLYSVKGSSQTFFFSVSKADCV